MSQSTDYKEVPTSERPNASDPPAYNSFNIMQQLKAAKELDDPKAKLSLASSIIFGSIISTVLLALSSAIPLAQLLIGIPNREKCTIDPMIPLWLIVSGVSGIVILFLKVVSNIILHIRKRKNAAATEPMVLSCFNCCGSLFIIVWFILGNVWVYSKWNVVRYDQILDPLNYCDKLTYLFAFWSITASYIFFGLFCICFCGVVVFTIGLAGIVCCISKK